MHIVGIKEHVRQTINVADTGCGRKYLSDKDEPAVRFMNSRWRSGADTLHGLSGQGQYVLVRLMCVRPVAGRTSGLVALPVVPLAEGVRRRRAVRDATDSGGDNRIDRFQRAL